MKRKKTFTKINWVYNIIQVTSSTITNLDRKKQSCAENKNNFTNDDFENNQDTIQRRLSRRSSRNNLITHITYKNIFKYII